MEMKRDIFFCKFKYSSFLMKYENSQAILLQTQKNQVIFLVIATE